MIKTKMSNKPEYICRLCLRVTEKEFEIDEIVKQMFEILLIKLDLGITRNPIICRDCMEVGNKCLSFKLTWIDTEKVVLSYSAYKKRVKHNIKIIYEQRKHMRIMFGENFDICRICMARWERNDFVSFGAMVNDSMFEMSEYMVEMDFNAIENPMICANCKENLNVYFKFVLNCVDTEEKIKVYCEEKATDRTDEVRLGDVLQFMVTDTLEYPDKYSKTYKIPEAFKVLLKQEELDIKNERTTKETENFKTVIQKDTRDLQSNISVDSDVFPRFKCSLCSYESKYKYHLKRHTLVHKDIPKINKFKCSLCTYECKYKSGLKYHMLVHKDVSEIDMHKCSLCTYESKHKRNVDLHMLVHKDISEIDMFKCSVCDFESKHKGSLKTHMLLHKDVSEIKMFKCSLCAYQCKHKGSLKLHLLGHNVSEVEMFKCSFCPYVTKRRVHLNSHMVVHKDVSEIDMFKCSFCGFESKYKGSLKTHMLLHKDVSEIKMFKCSFCTYQCRHKYSLKLHMLGHKDVSECV